MRIQGWESELEKYIRVMRKRLYKWGSCDCVLFTCNWIEKCVGFNPAAGAKGQYDTEESANEYLKKEYGSIEQGLDKHFARIDPDYMQRGDVAICNINNQATCGVVMGGAFVAFKAMPKGIALHRKPEVITAWRVE